MKLNYYSTISTIVAQEDRSIIVIEDGKINVWDVKNILNYDACALIFLYEEWIESITGHSQDCEMVAHGYSDCTCGFDNN